MVVGLVVFPLSGEVTNGEKLFALKVETSLHRNAWRATGTTKKIKGDLDMRSRESLLLGGEARARTKS